MAITKKLPNKTEAEVPRKEASINDAQIKALINKGGTPPLTPKTAKNKSNTLKNVQLRLTEDVLSEIDFAIQKRNKIVPISRHTWLLEAIAEKLDKESE